MDWAILGILVTILIAMLGFGIRFAYLLEKLKNEKRVARGEASLSLEEEKIFKKVVEKGKIPKSPQKMEQAVSIIKRKLKLEQERGRAKLDELKGTLTEMEAKGVTGREYDLVRKQYEGIKENMEKIERVWASLIEELEKKGLARLCKGGER